MKMRGRFLFALPALAGLLIAWTAPALSAAEPVTIRLAYGVPPAQITGVLFQKPDLLKHKGKSYNLKLIYARASSVVPPLLASKEADIGYVSYTAFANSVVNAKLDIRIVADLLQWGVQGWLSSYWSVLKDSKIKTVKDLKGKRIAIPAAGTALDMAMRVRLRKEGLEANRDYQVVEVRFPNMASVLMSGKVDAAAVIPAWLYEPKYSEKMRPLFYPEEALGRIQALFQVARTDFLKQHPAAAKDFMEDYLRAWKWFLTPANRNEALDIIARFTKRPRKVYESWTLTRKDYYRDPDARVDVAALQSNVDMMRKLGFLKRDLDVKPYVDMSFIEEAKKRLSK